MVHAMKKKNENLKFSRLHQQGHDISTQFKNDELYAWLLQFSLKKTPFWQQPLPFLKTISATKVSVQPPHSPDFTPTAQSPHIPLENIPTRLKEPASD
jgi:hypothetical protein